MKRQATPCLSEGPSEHRRQHTPFTRDVLTLPGAPIMARHRARIVLTPLDVRRAIIEDAASKPEPVRVRSLRRRLTVLDRMLSDQEAEALERLTLCVNSLSNIGAINYLKSEVRSTPFGRLPFNERKRREIEAMSYVLKALDAPNRNAVLHLSMLLDPSHSGWEKPDQAMLAAIWLASGEVVRLYGEWSQSERRAASDG